MTATISPAQIPEFLAKHSPFDRLSARTLQQMSERCQLLRYRMGQVVLDREKLPALVAVVHTGSVRILGYDRSTKNQASLKKAGVGEILGWSSLLRGLPTEAAIASTETICVTINAIDFLNYVQDEPEFGKAFREQAALAEVFEMLSFEIERRADATTDLKLLTEEALADTTALTLPPGRIDSARLKGDRLWILSSGQVEDYAIGDCLDPNLSLRVEGKKPARLVGVPARVFAGSHTALAAPRDRATDTRVTTAPEESHAIQLTDSGITSILAAPDSPRGFEDPLAPPPKYPYVRGHGQMDGAIACFKMLSLFLRLAFRRDPVRKALDNQLKRNGEITLYSCGGVAQMMGIHAQLGTITSAALGRLKAPVMIKWGQSFALLYSITEREIVMAVPERGILRKSPEEIAETWGETGQVLLLTPPAQDQEKFSFWWFLPSLAEHRKVLVEVFAASFFIQLFGLANPLITQVIIDKVLVQRSVETLDVLGIFVIGVALFEALLGYLRTYLFTDATNRIDLRLGSQVIDHLFRLPLNYFDQRRVGDLVGRVAELGNIRQFLTGTALTVVLNAVFSVIYVAVMLSYSLSLTVWALVTVPFYTLLIVLVSPIVRRQLHKRAERYADTQSYLVEALSGIQTVKAQTIELKSRWTWYDRYARFMNASFINVKTTSVAGSIAGFLNKLSGLLLLWIGARLVLENEMTLGQLIAFRIIAGNVTGSLLSFVQVWQNFQEVGMSVERLQDILNAEPEATEEEALSTIPIPDIQGHVKFEQVSFRFGQSGPLQLANIDLEFPPGTFVGIVGQSGSGKSTLMKLVQRLYEPNSGRIKVDGYDIAKVELYSLRRQIGVVLQDTWLFNGTVKDNISLTKPEATDEEIIEAAITAAAHEFIMGLPNGYNTVVGERGASLSGGQRQRVAIARTILQNPRMLILDEATSALDYTSERLVCNNLQAVSSKRTVFFITHRLPTVRNADTIVMMDQGSVVEQGTHDELMALKGRYYCLYQQQEAQM